jgi:hypothetical protein
VPGFPEEAEGGLEFGGALLFGEGEYQHADGGAWSVGTARRGIAETSVGALASAEEAEGLLDGIVGDLDAGVAGGEEGDDLGAADGGVRVHAFGGVTPGALGIAGLAGEDEIDRLFQGRAQARVIHHAVGFGEGERGEPVIVHRVANVTGPPVHLGEDEIQSLPDGSAVGTGLGIVSMGHHAEDGESHHTGLFAVRVRPVALRHLGLHQKIETADVQAFQSGRDSLVRSLEQFLRG